MVFNHLYHMVDVVRIPGSKGNLININTVREFQCWHVVGIKASTWNIENYPYKEFPPSHWLVTLLMVVYFL